MALETALERRVRPLALEMALRRLRKLTRSSHRSFTYVLAACH